MVKRGEQCCFISHYHDTLIKQNYKIGNLSRLLLSGELNPRGWLGKGFWCVDVVDV